MHLCFLSPSLFPSLFPPPPPCGVSLSQLPPLSITTKTTTHKGMNLSSPSWGFSLDEDPLALTSTDTHPSSSSSGHGGGRGSRFRGGGGHGHGHGNLSFGIGGLSSLGENEHRSDDGSMAHSMKDEIGNSAATLVMGADMIHLQSAQPTNDVDRASRIEVRSLFPRTRRTHTTLGTYNVYTSHRSDPPPPPHSPHTRC